MAEPLTPEQQLERMRRDWDERARANARYFVNTAREDWTDEEFFASGERTVDTYIRNDMINICQGRDPRRMKVLEIGCGAGRVTRALARMFGEVYAVDISAEMVRLARQACADLGNVHIEQNNGRDLACLGPIQVDFAFSTIVFQHIPSKEIIESYIREVHRLLRPRGLFKFQVQGAELVEEGGYDTWLGVPISEEEAIEMALRNGFEPRYRHGAGTQDFWLWYFKRSRARQLATYYARRSRRKLAAKWQGLRARFASGRETASAAPGDSRTG